MLQLFLYEVNNALDKRRDMWVFDINVLDNINIYKVVNVNEIINIKEIIVCWDTFSGGTFVFLVMGWMRCQLKGSEFYGWGEFTFWWSNVSCVAITLRKWKKIWCGSFTGLIFKVFRYFWLECFEEPSNGSVSVWTGKISGDEWWYQLRGRKQTLFPDMQEHYLVFKLLPNSVHLLYLFVANIVSVMCLCCYQAW
jgi:hypothetical protein